MNNYILRLIFCFLLFVSNSYAAPPPLPDEKNQIYKNITYLENLGFINKLSYQSPFISLKAKYKIFNIEFEQVKTFNIFGDCSYLPFPFRYCVRTNFIAGVNDPKVIIAYDNLDKTDIDPYYQPYSSGHAWEGQSQSQFNLGKVFEYLAILKVSPIKEPLFDVVRNNIYAYKSYQYGAKFFPEIINSSSNTTLSVLPFNLDFKRPEITNYNPDYNKNKFFTKVILEKFCSSDELSLPGSECIKNTDYVSSFEKMFIKVTPVGAHNMLPLCSIINMRNEKSNNTACITPISDNSGTVLPKICRTPQEKGCYLFRGANSYIPSGEFEEFYVLDLSILNEPFSRLVGLKPKGSIIEIDFNEDLSAGLSKSINFQDVDVEQPTSIMQVNVSYFRNDRYVCLAGLYDAGAEYLGCVERPKMDITKYHIKKCVEDENGCSEDFSVDYPNVVFLYGDIDNPSFKSSPTKIGEKITHLNWEFGIVPFNTNLRKVDNTFSVTNQLNANKICIWGAESRKNFHLSNKSDSFTTIIQSQNINIEAPDFWAPGFVKKYEKDIYDMEYFDSMSSDLQNYIISDVLPLHSDTPNLCTD